MICPKSRGRFALVSHLSRARVRNQRLADPCRHIIYTRMSANDWSPSWADRARPSLHRSVIPYLMMNPSSRVPPARRGPSSASDVLSVAVVFIHPPTRAVSAGLIDPSLPPNPRSVQSKARATGLDDGSAKPWQSLHIQRESHLDEGQHASLEMAPTQCLRGPAQIPDAAHPNIQEPCCPQRHILGCPADTTLAAAGPRRRERLLRK